MHHRRLESHLGHPTAMSDRYLPPQNIFKGRSLGTWILGNELGRGKNGVVYLGERSLSGTQKVKSAIKIIPSENLKSGWEAELEKTAALSDLPEVIQYRDHRAEILDSKPYVCIWSEFVNGPNLRDYLRANPRAISLPFIDVVLRTLLRVFTAMEATNVEHGDLHEGNILIKFDNRIPETGPIIKVGDFGIGGSQNGLKPKDDYIQLASICHTLLSTSLDPATLGDGFDKSFYRFLVDDFLPKYILETNHSVGDFVRHPRKLLVLYDTRRSELRSASTNKLVVSLDKPFDYLSCEQIGDSFDLLQTLYSSNFPGFDDLLQRANTILTGPRGCGKSTVFRNLSLKTQLLGRGRSMEQLDPFLGVYYHCGDLFFPFHHIRDRIDSADRRLLVHYFNLALMRELLDTLAVCERVWTDAFPRASSEKIEEFAKAWMSGYQPAPKGASSFSTIVAYVDSEKTRTGNLLRRRKRVVPAGNLLPLDFIPKLVDVIQATVPWLKARPIYLFLDDYSLPHISKPMQATLHDIILYRRASCFFKVSTESISTFYPQDSTGKLIEETREYDVIDLGSYFMQMEGLRKQFLAEIINNRLAHATTIHSSYIRIEHVLGNSAYGSYNELARQIRSGGPVHYSGIDTITDLFSGDIADLLRVVRGIFLTVGSYEVFSKPGLPLPIAPSFQDKAIRDYCVGFLDRIEAAPGNGFRLRKIAEAFGRGANWTLKNVDSKNEGNYPAKQAFRIEIRESFSFEDHDKLRPAYEILVPKDKKKTVTLESFALHLKSVYGDLLKYGVFLRDVRGKSQRGAVVPRLYLRRLLIPTFVLTPSQRDNIGLEAREFLELLYRPENFGHMLRRRLKQDLGQPIIGQQGTLPL